MTLNFMELTPDVGELFARYWARAVSPDRQGRLFLPFFHLHSDGFWCLLPRPGKENILASTKQIGSLNQLRDAVIGARLDDELYELLQEPRPRSILRTVLIEAYFAPEARPALTELGAINDEAFRYSERLLRQDYGAVAEVLTEEEAYRPLARDQGFRRAVGMCPVKCVNRLLRGFVPPTPPSTAVLSLSPPLAPASLTIRR